MMNSEGTSLGETIRTLRETRKITRSKLAESAGISESHLKKIETGSRKPGINTYQKIIGVLGADVVIKDVEKTLKGSCVAKVKNILMNSTDEQALYLTKIVECVSENMELVL